MCLFFSVASTENSGPATLKAVLPADILDYTFHYDVRTLLIFFFYKTTLNM